MRAFGGVERWFRRMAGIHRVGIPILMYHRVHDATSDPWSICVSPMHFNEQMEYLRRHFTLLRIGELVALLEAGRLPRRAVAITFDDGYADNLWTAKPTLERWDVPATVFVASGYLEQPREFWWDELHRVLLQAGSLPETIELRLDGRIFEWKLGDSANYTDEDCHRYRGWNAEQNDDPTPRHALYRSVYTLLHPLPHSAKRLMLDQLSTWSNSATEGGPNDRALSPDELISLEEGGLVEIGAHTVSHPVLSALPAAAQSDEIMRGRGQLEEILGHPVPYFSYPHGRYTAETIALVKRSAFTSACSSQKGLANPDTDSFQLPRIQIGNWNGQEFARRMAILTNW